MRSKILLLIWLTVVIIKSKQWSDNLSPSHSYFSFGIICGRLWDHLRSRIICGPFWGSFAVSGSFAVGDHLRYCTILMFFFTRKEDRFMCKKFGLRHICYQWISNKLFRRRTPITNTHRWLYIKSWRRRFKKFEEYEKIKIFKKKLLVTVNLHDFQVLILGLYTFRIFSKNIFDDSYILAKHSS